LRFARGDSSRAVIFCTLAAIALDYALAPAWYSSSPLLAVAVLLLLASRQNDEKPYPAVPAISRQRLLAFASLHAAIIAAGRQSASLLFFAAFHYSILTSVIVAGKLLVLPPALVLLPKRTWRDFALRFKYEMIAALVVLLTFFPYRLFQLASPYYSPLLGAFVYHVSLFFTPSLRYVAGPQPLILGPHLDVQIVFGCLGADGLALFDWLFGFVMFMEWRRCSKGRALLSYVAGVAAMLAANALRIVLMVLVGNIISNRWVIATHLNAGWLFFSFTFFVFMTFAYPFILQNSPMRASAPPARPNALLQNHAHQLLEKGF
jgi:exosortase/archaeosortase family protein